jgi:hypothetical protein
MVQMEEEREELWPERDARAPGDES